MFDSIYAAHGAFTAAVTPPLVVTLLLGVTWRRFGALAARWTLVVGTLAIAISIFVPALIRPVAQGVPAQLVQKTWEQVEQGGARVLVGSAGLGRDAVIEGIEGFATRDGRSVVHWPGSDSGEGLSALIDGIGEPALVVADIRALDEESRRSVVRLAEGSIEAPLPTSLLVIADSGAGPLAVGGGLFSGAKQYKYMRALFGLLVCFFVALGATLVTRRPELEKIRGYVWGTVSDAIRHYKGSEGVEGEGQWATAHVHAGTEESFQGSARLASVALTTSLAESLGGVAAGDLLYVSDRRWWLGGLRSCHVIVAAVEGDGPPALTLGPTVQEAVISPGRGDEPVRVKRLY